MAKPSCNLSRVADIECPACGEADRLNGTPVDDGIEITCEPCDTTWVRDPSPKCKECDGGDVEGAIKAVIEKSRGSQLSIVATQVVYLCRQCDAELLASYRISRSPLMPDQLPTM